MVVVVPGVQSVSGVTVYTDPSLDGSLLSALPITSLLGAWVPAWVAAPSGGVVRVASVMLSDPDEGVPLSRVDVRLPLGDVARCMRL